MIQNPSMCYLWFLIHEVLCLCCQFFFIHSGYVLSMAIVMKEMTKKRRKNRPRQKDQKGPRWAYGGAFLRPYLYMYTTSQCRTLIIIESCADTVYEAIHIRISMKRLWYKFIFYCLESVYCIGMNKYFSFLNKKLYPVIRLYRQFYKRGISYWSTYVHCTVVHFCHVQ